MPALINMSDSEKKSFRPSQDFLDVFWTLSEGDDGQRNKCVIKLLDMVKSLEKGEEKQQTLKYCRERLIRGLSSGRKFARVGFSAALTGLLRQNSKIDASELLTTIQEKLKVVRSDKISKREIGGIYLGRTFAYSAIIQSGFVQQLPPESVGSMTEELLSLAEKKSYLKAVCYRAVGDLLATVSMDLFAEQVWPRLRPLVAQGWEESSLSSLALMVTCRRRFPDIITKKFVKKHWGFPLLGEENDQHLLKVIKEAVSQKSDSALQTVLQSMLKTRDVDSIWSGLGEKLMVPGKKGDGQAMRQHLALTMASQLVSLTSRPEQVVGLLTSPSLARLVFHTSHRKNDPLTLAGNVLFQQIEAHLGPAQVRSLLVTLCSLDHGALVRAHNFGLLLEKLPASDVATYCQELTEVVTRPQDQRSDPGTPQSSRQKEAVLRQLHHLACSSKFTSLTLQKDVLSLFLSQAFFTRHTTQSEAGEKSGAGSGTTSKLCETFFFKSLDQLSTLRTAKQSKSDHLKDYTELLYHLVHQCTTLRSSTSTQPLGEEVLEEWDQLSKLCKRLKKATLQSPEGKEAAFLLLLLYLGLQSLTDAKTSLDLLQEVRACYAKAQSGSEVSAEPAWAEVLTEVLLQVVSNPSHLGRVVASMVFEALTPQLTSQAVQLLAQVLIPKSGHKDDAGGLFVEEDNEDNEDNEENDGEEEDSDLIDEDVPDEESSPSEEDSQDEEEDMEAEDEDDEEEEEGVQVEEEFRQKVREALGSAADDAGEDDEDGDDDEDLPDLSDSEMFKLDEMLAEVFRQRKKAGAGKKGREERKKEMANFRARVLDLVEVLVKGNRCGDFLLDLAKPLLLLVLKLDKTEHQALSDRARGLLHGVKVKLKTLSDTVHSTLELTQFYQELLELAHKVSDGGQVKEVALACHVMVSLARASPDSKAASQCLDQLKAVLTSVIKKKHSKLNLSFFTSMISLEPLWYQPLCRDLLSLLTDPTIKTQGKVITCSVLGSLAKKKDNEGEPSWQQHAQWMREAVPVVTQLVAGQSRDDLQPRLTRELLTLALALASRRDVFPTCPFPASTREQLGRLKPGLNTDLRRLANRLMAAVDSAQSTATKRTHKARGQLVESPAKGGNNARLEDSQSPATKKRHKARGQHVESPAEGDNKARLEDLGPSATKKKHKARLEDSRPPAKKKRKS